MLNCGLDDDDHELTLIAMTIGKLNEINYPLWGYSWDIVGMMMMMMMMMMMIDEESFGGQNYLKLSLNSKL